MPHPVSGLYADGHVVDPHRVVLAPTAAEPLHPAVTHLRLNTADPVSLSWELLVVVERLLDDAHNAGCVPVHQRWVVAEVRDRVSLCRRSIDGVTSR